MPKGPITRTDDDAMQRIAELEAENERLRKALEYIGHPQYDDRKYELMAAAREALAEKDDE